MTALEGAFSSAVECLEQQGVAYALIGALARNAWARPRASTDVDFALVADEARLAGLRAGLEERGFSSIRTHTVDPTDELPDMVFLRSPDGVRVDFLVAKTPFEQQAVSRSVRATVGTTSCRVVTPEDLIVYKLVAGRTRDLADVEEVVLSRRAARLPIDWSHVERWVSEFGYEDRLARVRERTDRADPE